MSPAWDVTREMFLSEAEVADLRASVESEVRRAGGRERLAARTDQVIVEVLLFSGLRTSEFCKLTLGDTPVLLAEPALRVRKPRGQSRMVYLPAGVCELIRRYAREVRPEFVADGDNADASDPRKPFVLNHRGRAYERTALYRRVVRILSRAGLGDRASVQLLRHTYGYLAYKRSGGNLLFVQRQLGHAHPIITSVYAEFVDESYAGIADRLIESPSSNRPRVSRKAAKGAVA